MATAAGLCRWGQGRAARPGRPGMFRVVALVALGALSVTPAMAALDDLAGPSDLARPALAPTPSIVSWQRLALNALLVPLLESDGPLAWAAPSDVRPCRDGAVTVDGHPLPHGQHIVLGRPFVIRFRLDDCWPLDTAWIGLSGTLEMSVLHEGPRLSATVRPLRLSAAINGARVPITAEFTGVVSLAAASTRP
jgi:hypothetical protein